MDAVPLALILVVTLVYVSLAARERARHGWDRARTFAFLSGVGILAAALSPWFDEYADSSFQGHMGQHLLIGMVAPLALVLSAPVTLLLRSLPPVRARRVVLALHSRPAKALANPVTALVLTSNGLVALYFTPLYELSTTLPAVHDLVHVHFLASGYLFAWVITGPDPAPHRPSVRVRLVVLGVAIAVHATVAQLLYAGLFVQVNEPVAELRAGGDLMYYGGDIAELLLGLALLLSWTSRRQPRATSPSSINRQAGGRSAQLSARRA